MTQEISSLKNVNKELHTALNSNKEDTHEVISILGDMTEEISKINKGITENVNYGGIMINFFEVNETNKMITIMRGFLFAQSLYQGTVYIIFTFVVIIQNTQNIQQSGFTGAGCSHDGNKLPFFYREIYTFEHMERLTIVVGLMYSFYFYQHYVVSK